MENTHLLLGCHVVVCTWHFLNLHNNDTDFYMPLCVYFEQNGDVGKSVTSAHLVGFLQLWDSKIGFDQLGFHPQNIGYHSLHSVGAMNLHQAGQYDSTIKVIRRSCSDAFLLYLQGEVTTFTKGVSVFIQ